MDDHTISFTITKTTIQEPERYIPQAGKAKSLVVPAETQIHFDIHIDDEYLDTVSSYEEAEAKMKCVLK